VQRPNSRCCFYRGRYGRAGRCVADAAPEVVDTMLAWPRHAEWI